MTRPEPKDLPEMIRRCVDAFVRHVGGMTPEQAKQGINQAADRIRLHPGLYWDAYSMAMGAAYRDGGNSVTIVATKLDALAKECEVINAECLQH